MTRQGLASLFTLERRFSLASTVLAWGITLLMVGLMARVAQLQLAPSADLREHLEPRVTTRGELPLRGDLLDRRGRVLASTRFASRVVVDPTLLPTPPDQAIVDLARAMDLPREQVGERIMRALEQNARRAAARAAAAGAEGPSSREALKNLIRDAVNMPEGQTQASAEAVPAEPVAVEETEALRGPIRYLPIGGVLTDEQAAAVRGLKIQGVMLEPRAVREYAGGEEVASIVGKVGFEDRGLMGAELWLDQALQGERGQMRFVRDSRGRPLWVEPGAVVRAQPGSDVRLSVDLELQRIAYEELMRGVEECDALGGRLVMIDPVTGEILAMVDIVRELQGLSPYPWVPVTPPTPRGQRPPPAPPEPDLTVRRRYQTLPPDPGRRIHPALARNRCVEDVYEPGSTFKTFVWATVTELGRAKPTEVFDTEGGRWRTSYGRYIEDVTKRQSMTWADVLVNSSNIGMIKGAERLSFQELREAVLRFGFGRPTGLGLPGEADGIVTSARNWSKYTHTSVTFGYEIAVTPVQMVRAFSAFARPGDLSGTMANLRLVAADDPQGESLADVRYRVVPPQIADLTRETLAAVATSMESRIREGVPEGGWRYTIYGKSGTAEIPLGRAPEGFRRPRGTSGYFDLQYNSSFIAAGPLESPRLVILVVIDDPGPERVRTRTHYGASTAGPVVRRVLERSLTYLNVPPSPRPEVAPQAPTRRATPQGGTPARTRGSEGRSGTR